MLMVTDNPINPDQPFGPDGNTSPAKAAPRTPRSGQRVSAAAKSKPLRSPGLNAEVEQLREDLRRINAPAYRPTDLKSAAAILQSVSDALFNLIRLLQTHQALRAGGEPIVHELETSLQRLSDDLEDGKYTYRPAIELPPEDASLAKEMPETLSNDECFAGCSQIGQAEYR